MKTKHFFLGFLSVSLALLLAQCKDDKKDGNGDANRISAIVISGNVGTMTIAQEEEVTATVTPSSSTEAIEWRATEAGKVLFTPVDERTVSVKALEVGTPQIYAVSASGKESNKLSVNITIPALLITDIALSAPPAIMFLNEEVQLTATPTPPASDEVIEWSASPNNIVSLTPGNNGRTVTVKALAASTTPVTITAKSLSGGAQKSVTTEVVPYSGTLKNVGFPQDMIPNPYGPNYWVVDWEVGGGIAPSIATTGTAMAWSGGPHGDVPYIYFVGWYGEITNGKFYQTIVLEAGSYQFTVNAFKIDFPLPSVMYVAAAPGTEIPNINNLSSALDHVTVKDGNNTVAFTLTERSVVTLGLVMNLLDADAFILDMALTKL